MREPRSTAAALATLTLLIGAWILLALGTRGIATTAPLPAACVATEQAN